MTILIAIDDTDTRESRGTGRFREFMRESRVDDLRVAGVDEVHTTGGETIRTGMVRLKKFPRPSLRAHRAILFVEEGDGYYHDVVMD
ncbi:MAG: hypothetical protein MUC66_01070 [Methanolinea sp.]|jgi:hypothetical protein|nr:hypothetical protein [Methanolinea sp.]